MASALVVAAVLLYQAPAVNSRLAWRIDAAKAYARGIVDPVGSAPTPLSKATATSVNTREPSPTTTVSPSPQATRPGPTATPMPTATVTPTPTPLPALVSLPAPDWEKQSWNSCGPASLALYLRYYDWDGDQYDISAEVKPNYGDRNVNVDELTYYVWNHVSGLNADFRVGGDIELLKGFLALGMPIMIEEGMKLNAQYWPNDDMWAGHYLLLTGYDDASQAFVGQDSFYGPDQQVSYDVLDEHWRAFNRVYIMVYRPEQEGAIRNLLGPHWDYEYNRQYALDIAQAEVDASPEDVYAWFNLGSNLVFFERYEEAAEVYDTVRSLGVPQRMWRYQFSPFLAYFHTNRIDDLLSLTDYALRITEQSEEALLWRGWGRYRQGEVTAAIGDFRAALQINPNYQDAKYALNFMGASP